MDVDQLVTEAQSTLHKAIIADVPFKDWRVRVIAAHEGVANAFDMARRTLNPAPGSAVSWALLNAEQFHRQNAAELRAGVR